jgi:hypothetical protein
VADDEEMRAMRDNVIDDRWYVIEAKVTFIADNDAQAGMIAAEIIALPLQHEAVAASEGDLYLEDSSEPLNDRTVEVKR